MENYPTPSMNAANSLHPFRTGATKTIGVSAQHGPQQATQQSFQSVSARSLCLPSSSALVRIREDEGYGGL